MYKCAFCGVILNKEFKGGKLDANSSYLLRPDKKLCGNCNEYEIYLRLQEMYKGK